MMARIRIGGVVDPSIQKSFSDIGKLTSNLKEELAPIGKIAGIGFAALGTGVAFAAKSSDEYLRACNQLQVSTGATKEEMEGLGDVLKGVYSNNYGENFEDISNSMGLVKQQMGDLSNTDLQSITEDAYAIKDTFDIDIGESVRGANQLMKQFGITGDEAYNLIAQGAQKGLNQNGDIADQVAEYAVYFSDLGYSAEDMFNVMISGAENGVFQIDFLNDAMKELGIRTKDNSDGTKQAFSELGLNADETTKMFANGGEEALKATSMVNQALFDMKDKVKQNQLGVQLYGTKWEDVGITTIEALGNITSEVDKTSNALDQIKEIKYDSFSQFLVGIKRQIEVAFLPLGEAVLPILNDFANWFKDNGVPRLQEFSNILKDNLPGALNSIGSGLQKVVPLLKAALPIIVGIGAALGALKIINIGRSIIGIMTKVGGIFRTVGSAVSLFAGGAGTLGEALGLIMGPVGWIILGIGALATGFTLLYQKCEPFREMINGLFSKLGNYITTTIMPAIQGVGEKFSGLFNAIGGFGDWLGVKLGPVFEVIFPMIGDAISLVASQIGGYIEGVITSLGGIVDFLTGVFSGNWQLALDGLKATFQGVFDSLTSIALAPFNWILDKIGEVKSSISSISFSGIGESLSSGISNIATSIVPKFANGGIATRPSICGEDGTPEMVIPLVKNARSLSLLQQAGNILGYNAIEKSGGFERNKPREISVIGRKTVNSKDNNNGGNSPTFIYAPQISGSFSEEEFRRLEQSFEDFKAMFEKCKIEEERVSFG